MQKSVPKPTYVRVHTAAQLLDQKQVFWCTFPLIFTWSDWLCAMFWSSDVIRTCPQRSGLFLKLWGCSISLYASMSSCCKDADRKEKSDWRQGTSLALSQVMEPVRGPVLPADPVWPEPSCSSLDSSHSAELIVSSSSWAVSRPVCLFSLYSFSSLPLPLSLSISGNSLHFNCLTVFSCLYATAAEGAEDFFLLFWGINNIPLDWFPGAQPHYGL